MCGICLAIDPVPRRLLNEFLTEKFKTIEDLKRMTDTPLGSSLITSNAFDELEKGIKVKDFNLINAMNSRNLKPLMELALVKTNMWENYDELRVYIQPHGFGVQINQYIEHYASEWTPHCGIAFTFVNAGPAEIIIQVNGNSVHSSQIGKEALAYSSQGQVTMHLGIGIARTIPEIRRPILHEFGHALGCIHEHQSPVANIQWNEPEVIRAYTALGTGWNEAAVRHNVFGKFNSGITNSAFDPDSIMIYPISADLTLDGTAVAWNTELSPQDIAFMRQAYSVK